QVISKAYRASADSAAVIREAEDVAAYLAVRMPAIFAVTAAVFAEVARILPEFAPRTLLDVGAGPGTASFAAVDTWPQIERVTMVDASAVLLATARQLASLSPARVLRETSFIERDFTRGETLPDTDLVVASYTLIELPEEAAAGIIAD